MVAKEFDPARTELGEAIDVTVEGEGTQLEEEIELDGEKGETIEGPVGSLGNGKAGMMGGESGRNESRLPAREGEGCKQGEQGGEGGGNKTSDSSSRPGGACPRPSMRLRIA